MERTANRIHHYVPAFLLRAWESPEDGKLEQFGWRHGRLKTKRWSAQHVAKIAHLYSRARATAQLDVSFETQYMTAIIDTPAAAGARRTLSRRTGQLRRGAGENLVAIPSRTIVRVPTMVAHIREARKAAVMSAIDDAARSAGAGATPGDAKERLYQEFLTRLPSEFMEDIGVDMMANVIQATSLNGAMHRANWTVMELDDAKVDLLIGDRPLIRVGPLSGDFMVALPISPCRLFVGFTVGEFLANVQRETATAIAKAANRNSVEVADKYVYGTGTSHFPLIAKYLTPPPD